MDSVKLLVKKSQKGDTKAFEQLVTMYQDKIYALGYQLTGNHADAQDLAQNAFIKAYRSLSGFRNEADFGTWLHRITVNLSLNEKRKKKAELSLDNPVQTEDGEMQRLVVSDGDTPEEAFEKKEFRGLVHTALKNLSSEHRTILVLREMQDYSYEEIADVVGCNLGTVKSRMSRARKALKKEITKLAAESGRRLPYQDKHKAGGKQ
ncbi:MAG: sigma-70 family RNA polymerase sigma factor [Clostridiales bacterium]|nr:sigma-70 family RNA polymerase sigma factor [Clostridiales bacterium]MCF8023376.1 sigma-70 family RNA polymerase sigma factor [Clostridiales bacterium]